MRADTHRSDVTWRDSLVPREVLFGNPERTNARISPDGIHLAYLAPDEKDVLQVWVRTIGRNDDRRLTNDRKRGIRDYGWTYDREHLVYMQDADGDENWHLFSVNMNTGVVRDLTPFQDVQAQGLTAEPQVPDALLVGMNVRDRRVHDMYRVDLNTGAVELAVENPGQVVQFEADRELAVRAAVATAPDGGWDLLIRPTTDAKWETVRHWGADEEGRALGFSADGATLYVVGNHDANAMELVALDVATRCETVIARDEQYDVTEFFVHPTKRTVQAAGFYRDRLAWQVLDDTIEEDFEVLGAVRGGEFRVVDRDLADATWIVSYTTDDGPVYFYAYDRSTKHATLIFSSQPKLEGLALASMKPLSYTTRDGLTIHGYLTLPVGVSPTNLPTVLLVHGGPWARDTWGFRAEVQWLANRGYAVLQVNYRGSTGYGKAFVASSFRQWGGTMHDDLIDAVNWLIDEGVADPKRVAIMGGSYGGYATLAGLAFTPEVFAMGIDIVGISNLLTFIKSIPPYWEPAKALIAHRVGDIDTEPEFLESRSPLFFADRITKPLLIGQGANDPRVKQAESEQIVEAMREAGRPVEYVVYSDEGHGFARPENRLHFYAIAEAFLAKHLGGQVEPAAEIAGHSGTIR